MLNTYNIYYASQYTTCEPNVSGEISRIASLGKTTAPLVARDISYISNERTNGRCYRLTPTIHAQTAIGRIRAALVRVFPQFDHAVIGAIAKQVFRAARHVRLDSDNPNTHLAFSPGVIGAHDAKNRRSLTFAKFLRRKCAALLIGRLVLTDSQIENAQYGFQLLPTFPLALKLVTGEDAYAVYADDEHGIESCMSGESDKSDIVKHHFCANPGALQLVTARHGKQLMIRSKLFANVNGKTHFLDRIYWKKTDCLSSVTQEAELREWLINWLAQRDIAVSDVCDAKLRHDEGEPMPYLDRCKQFDRDGDVIRIRKNGDFTADNTDGTDESLEGGKYTCCNCDCRVDEDDVCTNDYGSCYCENCYSDLFSWDDVYEEDIPSEDCVEATRVRRGRNETCCTHRDNCQRLYNDEYALSDDCVELHNGEYALSTDEDIYELSDGEYALAGDIETLHDGRIVLRDNDNLVEMYDGEYALNTDSDVILTIDGEYALSGDCVELTDDYGNVCYVLSALACV